MKENILYTLYYCIFKTIALCPLRILYVLSDLVYFVLYHCIKYRLPIVRENLRTSFPDKSDTELRKVEKGFYRHLSDTMVETIKLLHISRKELEKRIVIEGADLVEEIAKREHPVILFIAHLGNWEWVPEVQFHYKEPKISGEVYKEQHDAAFNRLMKKIRSRYPSLMIPQENVYRDLLSLHQNNKSFIIGFIADHRSNSSVSHNHVQFLNHNTPVTIGAEKIGDKIGAEYLYLEIMKPSRGHYNFTFKKLTPSADNTEIPYTTAYYKQLENNIITQPEIWLWSHRRWLYK